MYESVKRGKIVFEYCGETLSDGTKGCIEENSVTFEPCRDLVDDWIIVSEDEISKAVYFMLEHHHKVSNIWMTFTVPLTFQTLNVGCEKAQKMYR